MSTQQEREKREHRLSALDWEGSRIQMILSALRNVPEFKNITFAKLLEKVSGYTTKNDDNLVAFLSRELTLEALFSRLSELIEEEQEKLHG